jgi:hypothetical protein
MKRVSLPENLIKKHRISGYNNNNNNNNNNNKINSD